MLLTELIAMAGALCAPAFFLLLALAALGAPPLALLCLLAAKARGPYLEAYARRLVHMALTCAAPVLPVFLGAIGLLAWRQSWLADWLLAAPLLPAIFCAAVLAYAVSLLTLRHARPGSQRRGQDHPLAQTALLCLQSLAILWLGSVFFAALQDQALAVLHAPVEGGITVAPLLVRDLGSLPQPGWSGLAAATALGMACAGAASLEYLLLLRDREPFGREAQANMLRLAGRCTLRAGLLAGAFLPALWRRLPDMPALPGGLQWAQWLLVSCALACALLCLLAGLLARSRRPWERGPTAHGVVALAWTALTALLSIVLLVFYGA